MGVLMTYDQWKCTDPNEPYGDFDEDYDPERDCGHEHYEIDVCMGRAECEDCPKVWYLTDEQVMAELDRQANYWRDMAREKRRECWRKFTLLIRWPIFRMLECVWPRKACSVLRDEEIPF
jgi:hypothetical protein